MVGQAVSPASAACGRFFPSFSAADLFTQMFLQLAAGGWILIWI
jgi:hypothetical protein